MRARPAGPAQSSVFHNLARRGPTKEAHRRALDRPDGLLHSGASDQGKPAEAGAHCPVTPEGPIEGGVEGPIRGDQGTLEGPIQGVGAVPAIALQRCEDRSELAT